MQTEKRPSSQGATWGLAILLGIVGVSFQQSVGGFVIGAALGVLLAQIFYLRSRTETLDRQLQELKQRLASISSAKAPSASAVKRNSIGNMLCSAAYFARNAAPKNRITMPARAIGLPRLSHAMNPAMALSKALGGRGGAGGAGGAEADKGCDSIASVRAIGSGSGSGGGNGGGESSTAAGVAARAAGCGCGVGSGVATDPAATRRFRSSTSWRSACVRVRRWST